MNEKRSEEKHFSKEKDIQEWKIISNWAAGLVLWGRKR